MDVNLRRCMAITRDLTLDSIVIMYLRIILRYRTLNVYRKNVTNRITYSGKSESPLERKDLSNVDSKLVALEKIPQNRQTSQIYQIFGLLDFSSGSTCNTVSAFYHPRRDICASFPVVLDISDVRSRYRSQSKMKFARGVMLS